jgi:dipeptidyl aminopeptidase/acylaminoacyl peptidase
LRKPGSHARAVYTVAPDGSGLKEILAFDGTIVDLRYGAKGKLAMLAIAGANKEVGATQAGASITGDLSGPAPEQRIGILENGKLHWASPADLFVYEYDWLPDGSGFVGTAAKGDGDNNWWVAKLYRFDAGDVAAHVIFAPPDARHQIADPVVSPDGKTVAFISGLMSDFGSTGGDSYVANVNGGSTPDSVGMKAGYFDPTPDYDRANYTVRSLAWSCDGHLRAELLRGPHTLIVEYVQGWEVTSKRFLYTGEDTLHGDMAGISFSCSSHLLAAVHESFELPPEIELGDPQSATEADYKAGELVHWHDLTHENAGLTMQAMAQSVSWKSDGFTIQGWLLLPLNIKGKIPMIMMVHGGPANVTVPNFSGPGFEYDALAQGYALFYPNPRGSFGQGEAFTTANVRDFGYGDLRDDLAGIDAVEKIAPIDDDRLGIRGGSYGGFMTMWAVTQTHRFKAGVASAGISDWLSYYGENGIDKWLIPYFGASAYDDPKIYARSSPINFIKNVTTPVFAYVGANDLECPAPQTQEFWHALHELGVPASYAIYPDEGHGLRDPAHLADMQKRALAWFDKYLR